MEAQRTKKSSKSSKARVGMKQSIDPQNWARVKGEGKQSQDTVDTNEDQLRYALARELLGVCTSMLVNYGVNISRLGQSALLEAEVDNNIPTAQSLFRDLNQLGELMNEWAEESLYVDATGHPKILPITGTTCSFSTLAKKYFDSRSTEEVLQLGFSTRVLEPIGTDRVAHLSSCVVLAGNPTLVLAHAVCSVRYFLATTLRNATASASDCILPDRKAATIVSEEDLPDFVAAMRQQTVNLVEMGNRWLTARAAMNRSSEPRKRAVMGVHAYLFTDTSLNESREEFLARPAVPE